MKALLAIALGLPLLIGTAHAYPGCWWDGYTWQCPPVFWAPPYHHHHWDRDDWRFHREHEERHEHHR